MLKAFLQCHNFELNLVNFTCFGQIFIILKGKILNKHSCHLVTLLRSIMNEFLKKFNFLFKKFPRGCCCGGPVVIVLNFYSDDPSSDPNEVYKRILFN